MDQLKKLFEYLMSDKQGTFRYLIYDIMGFDNRNYGDLYCSGLMGFKDWIDELKTGTKYLEIQHIADCLVEEATDGEALYPDMTPETQHKFLCKAKKIYDRLEEIKNA